MEELSKGIRKGENQKQKLLHLVKIFFEETDENHDLSMKDLIAMLKERGVNSSRKILYQDMEELRSFGFDILKRRQGKEIRYFMGNRSFQLIEVKMLVDTVQFSRFLTEKKSRELIEKLRLLTSRYEGESLTKEISFVGSSKTPNEMIYYSGDTIYQAMLGNNRIHFHYRQWTPEKKLELRHNGSWYHVSPWRLVCDHESYYLIAYDVDDQSVKHFRMDKIVDAEILEGDHRDEKEKEYLYEPSFYANRYFGMFSGDVETVELQIREKLIGPFIDRFGTEPDFIPVEGKPGWYSTEISVVTSNQFFGWLIGLGSDARAVGPDSVLQKLHEMVLDLAGKY